MMNGEVWLLACSARVQVRTELKQAVHGLQVFISRINAFSFALIVICFLISMRRTSKEEWTEPEKRQ